MASSLTNTLTDSIGVKREAGERERDLDIPYLLGEITQLYFTFI